MGSRGHHRKDTLQGGTPFHYRGRRGPPPRLPPPAPPPWLPLARRDGRPPAERKADGIHRRDARRIDARAVVGTREPRRQSPTDVLHLTRSPDAFAPVMHFLLVSNPFSLEHVQQWFEWGGYF